MRVIPNHHSGRIRRALCCVAIFGGLIIPASLGISVATQAPAGASINCESAPLCTLFGPSNAKGVQYFYSTPPYTEFWAAWTSQCSGSSNQCSLYPVWEIKNDTGYRVWIHQYANWTGWTHCFSSGTDQSVPSGENQPADIYVSGNTSAC